MKNKLIPYYPKLKDLARKLRKESTLSEVLLWKEIKNKSLGVEFHRQVPLDNFIVDFYSHELMLAIEIDGMTHQHKDAFKEDLIRQEILESFGVTFIRFQDIEIKRDIANVLRAVEGKIEELREQL